MKRCISGQKVGIFFPFLMMALCKSAEVLMEENKQLMYPTKSLIDMFDLTHQKYGEEEQECEEQEESEDKETEGNEEIAFEEEEED
ncbi:hypothetical protein PVK06_035391 [Gossypium arboreum]|uniref:Uncharacterized protein n=1 Tax=Gossypium arboreum TaxID=29729 RepID=A0ABR0NHU9_GOSAR|nr:hypothetical protein PVK06_035391 [Gossypium arboreum]